MTMDRRDALKSLAALVGATGLTVAPVRKYGRLTIAGHRHHLEATGQDLHVYVDGVEALHCYEADDVDGYALVFCRDPEQHRAGVKAGHLHVGGDGHACRLRLTGHVVFTPGPRRT
jgi:hypothetical protein